MGKTIVVTNSLSGGGAERSMNSLVNLLHRNSVAISLFPLNEGHGDAVLPVSEVISPVRTWKAGLIPTLASFFEFRSKMKKEKPSLVIVNCELPELYSIFLPLRFKLICVEHTSKPWQNHKFMGFWVRMAARLRKAHWVLVSDHLTSKVLYRKPYSVIPNLISAPENRLAEGLSPVTKIFFIGRLSIEKDPELFLEIAEISKQPAAIIGSGVLADKLLSLASLKSIAVQFLGHLNNPWAEIHSNDIIIVTSRFEGDGLVLLEAISRGLPILVRDIPDLRRFGLPEVNYFQSASSAANMVLNSNSNSASLRIPMNIADQILSKRNDVEILKLWVGLINRFTTP